MTKAQRKLARKLSSADIVTRFPKGGIDTLTYTVAARAGGPTGRADDNFGAKECRAAFNKQRKPVKFDF